MTATFISQEVSSVIGMAEARSNARLQRVAWMFLELRTTAFEAKALANVVKHKMRITTMSLSSINPSVSRNQFTSRIFFQ